MVRFSGLLLMSACGVGVNSPINSRPRQVLYYGIFFAGDERKPRLVT
jgi:hypothetical protein